MTLNYSISKISVKTVIKRESTEMCNCDVFWRDYEYIDMTLPENQLTHEGTFSNEIIILIFRRKQSPTCYIIIITIDT